MHKAEDYKCRQEKFPFKLLVRVVKDTLKIILAITTALGCLPEHENKTLTAEDTDTTYF